MTNDLNSVLLEGHLTGEPVTSEHTNGVDICSFEISTIRMYKVDEEVYKETTYISVVTYSTLAENCNKHLHEGRGVRVVGRIKLQEIDGDNKLVIIAEHVEFKPVKSSNN